MSDQEARRFWTNPAVLAVAQGHDPVEVIIDRARSLVLNAIENGWAGPPFDIFALADYLKIPVVPHEDTADARTTPIGSGRVGIEFNPNKPLHRIRYSIAHELAHTLFPDSYKQTRNRLTHAQMSGDDWQLESLCNIAAAEFLMPVGSLPQLREEVLSVDHLLPLREKYDVSLEALFLRVVRLTDQKCGVVCASRIVDPGHSQGRYRVDYSYWSGNWQNTNLAGRLVPKNSAAEECTAIGFTSKKVEAWQGIPGQLAIECVGIPPYPNHVYPRVLTVIKPQKKERTEVAGILYLIGDATKPRGTGHNIIAHVVNDKASTWGGGFAKEVRNKWPEVQEDFKRWAVEYKQNFSLGHVHLTEINRNMDVVHMISQHGYGPSLKPGIRYLALRACLLQLAKIAIERAATIHMPRIGSGEARGRWVIVEELIRETLSTKGLQVIVYDLPSRKFPKPSMLPLFPSRTP